eukprot:gene17374-23675_t
MGIVMKFYPMSLADLMRTQDFAYMSIPDRVCMSLELAKGVLSLHDHPWTPIVHGDPKPSNVLVEPCAGEKWACAISDFGSATLGLAATTTRNTGANAGTNTSCTWLYAAPELMAGKKKRAPADVYSLGLVIAQIFIMEAPYNGEQCDERVQRFIKDKTPLMEQLDSHDPEVMPARVHSMVLGCLDPRPEIRPSALQIVELLVLSYVT